MIATAKRVVARLTHTHGIWRLIPQGVKYWVNNNMSPKMAAVTQELGRQPDDEVEL